MILVSLWTQTEFGVIYKIIQIYERYDGANIIGKLNNTELFLKLFHIQSKEFGNNKCYGETTQLEKWHGKVRFHLTLERRWKTQVWMPLIKQLIPFVKGRLNFSSKTTTAAKVPLTESLLDNWLKNNHIIVDKIYYLRSLFVSFFFFFTNFSFQIYFSTAENRKTFCGNALNLDLIE